MYGCEISSAISGCRCSSLLVFGSNQAHFIFDCLACVPDTRLWLLADSLWFLFAGFIIPRPVCSCFSLLLASIAADGTLGKRSCHPAHMIHAVLTYRAWHGMCGPSVLAQLTGQSDKKQDNAEGVAYKCCSKALPSSSWTSRQAQLHLALQVE